MLNDTIPDEDAVEEATQILSNVESEIGRTTDPVNICEDAWNGYRWSSCTSEDEISIAKRIEEGIDEVQTAIAAYPEALTELLNNYDQVEAGNYLLADLITGLWIQCSWRGHANIDENFADEDESAKSSAGIDDEAMKIATWKR